MLMKAQLSIIGNNPSTPPGRNDPNSACFVAGTVPTFAGTIAGLAKEDGVKKIGVLEPSIPGVQHINAAVKAAAAANGAQITNVVPLAFTVTNFGPPLQQVLAVAPRRSSRSPGAARPRSSSRPSRSIRSSRRDRRVPAAR